MMNLRSKIQYCHFNARVFFIGKNTGSVLIRAFAVIRILLRSWSYVFFGAWLVRALFNFGVFMFEDIERIEWLDRDAYRRAMYYLQHPAEYNGDFDLFRRKLLDYGDRLRDGSVIREHYRSCIKNNNSDKQ